jgi:hypothetical protein
MDSQCYILGVLLADWVSSENDISRKSEIDWNAFYNQRCWGTQHAGSCKTLLNENIINITQHYIYNILFLKDLRSRNSTPATSWLFRWPMDVFYCVWISNFILDKLLCQKDRE